MVNTMRYSGHTKLPVRSKVGLLETQRGEFS